MRAVAPVALALIAGGCIESRVPFEARDREPPPADHIAYRLTHSWENDRWPSWTPDGGVVLYVAEAPDGQPVRGALFAIPGDGVGAAVPVLQAVPTFPWLLTPRQSPVDDRVAFVEISHAVPAACGSRNAFMACSGAVWRPFAPLLVEMRLRVRSRSSTGFIGADPSLTLHLGTQSFDEEYTREGYVVEMLNFQPWNTLFATEDSWVLRPDWSPDGRRVVFADGARLRIWTPDDPAATVVMIPGTQDGVSPAWRPDGEWIAYTRLVRGATTFGACLGMQIGEPVCAVDQTIVNVADRVLVLTRPDGSEEQVLGRGEDPAWGPDGSLYFRLDNQIWRHTAPPVPVPGTLGGREPAVSPDGRHIAFSAADASGTYDIWVARLQP